MSVLAPPVQLVRRKIRRAFAERRAPAEILREAASAPYLRREWLRALVLGIIGIVYAFILPLLGMNQETLLIGNLHWLIQVIHMLVGVGSLALAGVISVRYRRLKQAKPSIQ